MTQARLLCRTAHVRGNHKNKVSFDLHNLRLEELKPEEKNYNPEDSHENIIFQNGKKIPQSQFPELLKSVKDETDKAIKSVKGDMSEHHISELNLSRAKTKHKIKKWADNSENYQEALFFEQIQEKIGVEKINANEEIEKLKSFGKVKKLNNKVKAIQDLEKCNKLLGVKENNSLSLKVVSSEKIFKIPDQHEINIKAEDWNIVIDKFHNNYYKEFDAFYTAIHLDEKKENPHAHHRINGLNKKTGKFDLPDHELNLVRKIFDKPDLFEGRKWSKLETDEVVQFGKMYQNIMFKFCNQELKKLGYDVDFVKRTPEEVQEDNHTYSNSKIRNRVFNGANKIQEKVESWFLNIKTNIKKAVSIHLEIDESRNDIGKMLLDEVDEQLNQDEAKKYKTSLAKGRNKLR